MFFYIKVNSFGDYNFGMKHLLFNIICNEVDITMHFLTVVTVTNRFIITNKIYMFFSSFECQRNKNNACI